MPSWTFSHNRNLIKLYFKIISNVYLELFFFTKTFLLLSHRHWITTHFYWKQHWVQPGLAITRSYSDFNKGGSPWLSWGAAFPACNSDGGRGRRSYPIALTDDYKRTITSAVSLLGLKGRGFNCRGTWLNWTWKITEPWPSFPQLTPWPQTNHSLPLPLPQFLLTAKRAK